MACAPCSALCARLGVVCAAGCCVRGWVLCVRLALCAALCAFFRLFSCSLFAQYFCITIAIHGCISLPCKSGLSLLRLK